MTSKDQSLQRRSWKVFLLTAAASIVIWDGFYFFVFYDWVLALGIDGMLLTVWPPLVAVLLLAYFLVWRKQKDCALIVRSVLTGLLLTIGIAVLAGHLHAAIYPVHAEIE